MLEREYKDLPSTIISPFTGDELVLEPEIEIVDEGRGKRSTFCFADTDGDETFYYGDVLAVYSNSITRETIYI
jgi:hypothetical protein